MLLGVVAAATAPLAPRAADLVCRLADPFLLALIAVARGGRPSRRVDHACRAGLAGPAAVAVALAAARGGVRHTWLASPARRPTPERMVRARDDHRRRNLRQAALSPPEAEERETWGHPTFRVRGKLFAALADDGGQASVKATRQEQEALVAADPETFGVPAYVGRHGWVSIRLNRRPGRGPRVAGGGLGAGPPLASGRHLRRRPGRPWTAVYASSPAGAQVPGGGARGTGAEAPGGSGEGAW